MSEDGELWAAVREEGRQKKQSNLTQSIEILKRHGIQFQQFSPVHLRIGEWDFWPSTGKFWNRNTNVKGRGVFNLLRQINPVRCIECGAPSKIIAQCLNCGGPVGECCPHHYKNC